MPNFPSFKRNPKLVFSFLPLLVLFHLILQGQCQNQQEYLKGLMTSRDPAWIGGDGVFSVELGFNERIWLFGDTWITKGDGKPFLASNSVAIQRGGCEERILPIWTQGPGTFLTAQDGIGWFWPSGGALINGSMLIVLHRLVRTGQTPWDFQVLGSELLLIPNPRAPPSQWPLEPHRIPWAKGQLLPCSPVTADNHLYLFFTAPLPSGQRALKLARTPIASILNNGPDAPWEFWGGEQGWKNLPEHASVLFSGLGTEYTVTQDPTSNRWLCVYSPQGISSDVLMRTALAPWGPWSDAIFIYSCPEASVPNLFCYGAKLHRGCSEGGLWITYSVNSKEGTFLDESIWRPRWVVIPHSLTRN